MPPRASPGSSSTSTGGGAPDARHVTGAVRISLIITTYNWPAALDLVLKSVSRQRRLPDEVIVADDGSGAETAEVVASWSRRIKVPVHHIWQENKGFRAGRSRNRGIAAARGNYIIFIDGDMVLDEHFVADHASAMAPGYFIQGLRIATNAACTARMLARGSTSFGVFTRGLRRPHLALRSPWLSARLSRQEVRMGAIKSCNEGFWRADLVAVNGFNEAIKGWGPEDKECVARLVNLGVQGKHLRFAGLAAHLDHRTRAPGGDNPNDAILAATLASHSTRCDDGLDQHLQEFAGGIPASARSPWRT
jgi:glycosyltransferase involved in cell wall biosynthesis